jgi:XRE family transcriptional regulator, regulator of sulfur utilization
MDREDERLRQAIGRRVRELRTEKRSLSQEGLARQAGLHFTFVARVERGETGVTVQSVAALCRPLGVSLSEFFRPFERTFDIRGPGRRRRGT